MNKDVSHRTASQEICYPRFAAFYTWMTNRPLVRRWEDPLRWEIVGEAQGIVLEVGAGGGQNFPFYDADRVERVEATEPDEAMLVVARRRLVETPVPITLTNAAVEALPFPNAQFDRWWQHWCSVPSVIPTVDCVRSGACSSRGVASC